MRFAIAIPTDATSWKLAQRAEELGGPKQTRKQRATSELFTKRFPKSEQTEANFRHFEKYIKNARDEWRPIDRAMKVAGAKRVEIQNANRLFKAR